MFDKQRLPFILLGIGIGIILTNMIYTFNPNIKYKDHSEEEIVALATDLGMVFIKDSIDTSPKTKEPENSEEKQKLEFVIKYGDTLEKVSNGLFELGIINDVEEFQKFAKNEKVDRKLRVGTYKFLPNSDYETIIKEFTTPWQ